MTIPACEPELRGQTVVVIGASASIGPETAKRARTEGAELVLVGRNPGRPVRAAEELGTRRNHAFDATDVAALATFFRDLPSPIDHVMVTAGAPSYGTLLDMSAEEVRDARSDHAVLELEVARNAASG